MQDRYTGDIGDYGKLGLLRCLAASGLCIGVNWYRTLDEGHNADGRFIQYLQDAAYEVCDPLLFRALARIVTAPARRVESLESPGILDAVFFNDTLDFQSTAAPLRPALRADWHKRALAALKGRDVIFVDPDNGLMVPSAQRSKKGNKYVLPEELFDYYRQGSSVIYYQHKARRLDDFYIAKHRELLSELPGAKGLGVKFTRTSLRYYWFLLHPEHSKTVHRALTDMLSGPWGFYFQLCGL